MPSAILKSKAPKMLQDLGYTNLEFIGEGGQAIVYKCNNKTGNTVAVRLAEGTEEEISREIASSKELDKQKPEGWEKHGEEFLEHQKLPVNMKHWFKYNNVPIFKERQQLTSATEIVAAPQTSVQQSKVVMPSAAKRMKFSLNLSAVQKQAKEDPIFVAIFEAPLAQKDVYQRFLDVQLSANNALRKIQRISKHALKALEELNKQGLVHDDIKPQNLLKVKRPSKKITTNA